MLSSNGNIDFIQIEDRKIAIKGIGKLFYQEGFPISMAIETLNKSNIEVSIFHVVDELIKHGWNNKTILSRLKEDDITDIELFLESSYEDQRAMIYEYLYNSDGEQWLRDNIRSFAN